VCLQVARDHIPLFMNCIGSDPLPEVQTTGLRAIADILTLFPAILNDRPSAAAQAAAASGAPVDTPVKGSAASPAPAAANTTQSDAKVAGDGAADHKHSQRQRPPQTPVKGASSAAGTAGGDAASEWTGDAIMRALITFIAPIEGDNVIAKADGDTAAAAADEDDDDDEEAAMRRATIAAYRELRFAAVEAVCRLLLTDRYSYADSAAGAETTAVCLMPQIMTALITMAFHPTTANDPALRQCLTVFFTAYVTTGNSTAQLARGPALALLRVLSVP
jgi:hypothetical protein